MPLRSDHPSRDPRVLLLPCEAYEVERIRALVGQAMATLELRPNGRREVRIHNKYGFNRSYLAWRGNSAPRGAAQPVVEAPRAGGE
jgi:hypothetical protein